MTTRDELFAQLNNPQLGYSNIIMDAKDIDMEVLHNDIKADLGEAFIGMSTASCEDGDFIVLHVSSATNGTDRSKARKKFDDHDKSKLPPKPVVKSDKERIAELEAAVADLLATRGANPR